MTDRRAKARQNLIAKFQTIARERLEKLNNSLVELETKPDNQATIALVMREIHTLKGEAKLMGFADVNLVAHKTEDLLLYAKKQKFRVSAELTDRILQGFDIIGYLLHKQAGVESSSVDLGSFLGQADQLLGVEVGTLAQGGAFATPPPGTAPLATLIDKTPEVSMRVDIQKLDTLTELVGGVLRRHMQMMHMFSRLNGLEKGWAAELQDRPAGRPEELVEALRTLHGEYMDVLAAAGENLFEAGDQLDELENTVRDLRLVPLSTLWGRFPRAVRDLAKEQGKQVRVSLSGGEFELDKHVLDRLDEPLLHLVRNAVDHGIESPEERRVAKKRLEATIALTAVRAGGHIKIVVGDDGRGMDAKLIRKTAVARGLLRQEEELEQRDVLQLVFLPGFSTRAIATDISGRGIGLDVVKNRVEGLGGTVGLESVAGQGTRTILRVPISVAITRVLVVEHSGVLFAFPSHLVNSVTALVEERIEPAGNGHALRLPDDTLLPLAEFGALVGSLAEDRRLHPSRAGIKGSAQNRRQVVAIESGGRRLGLMVGRIVGERECVQRPLEALIEEVPILIGATIVEHGEPAFVLNVAEIVRSLSDSRVLRPVSAERDSDVAVERKVLLVEDSELTRDMLRGFIRTMGHQVLEAVNGRDALERLELRPDLVMTDLEMPVMDGFELISQIRGSSAMQDVPIIVLSSRGSDDDKRRAAAAGADAYLVKSEFREDLVIETVNRFLEPKKV